LESIPGADSVWLIIGMAIYLSYGRKHSRVSQYVAAHDKLSAAKR
jgi:hypothetical protein